MTRIVYDVIGKEVQRSVDGVRPGHQQMFVVADVLIVNHSDLRIRVRAVPAVFEAADGTRYDQVVPRGVVPPATSVGPRAASATQVVFAVPRTLAGGGTVKILGGDVSPGDHYTLAS
ncbi:hypothetical protein CLV56_3177 [Mumia flava]|uniref:DUF4352 domain-containing protein n=1 Tax=Mumia flava TaxID=1348852 RepID=A0A0B2BPU1_9ACTN|nr:hypothetical protein [Mumia flava]PJJ53686.1 hypothetical protein CLV56_3177 [Mumia flava]